MNTFELLVFKIRSFFTKDRAISKVKNDLLKMEISYIEADTKIKEAEEKFNKIKVTEANKFSELKKNTLFKTLEKIQDLKDEILTEGNEIDSNYRTALSKLAENSDKVEALEETIVLLKAKEHTLSRS